ncbi:LPS-assembly lipoprotein [Roseivivax lentus]|uniref:LPS-assembly lipoprotein n=1 Tax=Roseivivax lentus TaxID=633194 RepID=A0A1N7K1Y1_9RHOB|nr:LPS assembly lipoprotein LptE [Roseivivax lentus]SIS55571.1 LPS-assembly lipoprotein [Roseivivax lentus]
MSSSDRRQLLAGLAGLAGLAACGFTPAYGPAGGASDILGTIAVAEPSNRNGYLLVRRLEERLGRASGPMQLDYEYRIDEQDFGTTSAGFTTRYRLVGTITYELKEASGRLITRGTVEEFVGFSATGSIVSTPAARADAEVRLATILADRMVEELIFAADLLPPA